VTCPGKLAQTPLLGNAGKNNGSRLKETNREVDKMPEEKRRFSRIVFKVAAELKVGSTILTTKTVENLSVGGCLLPVSGTFPLGNPCRVTLHLDHTPNSLKVRVSGEIIRCDPAKIGIKFTGIDPDSLFHLHNILRYNASDPDRIEEEIENHPGLV
jgi:PilZ domain